MPIIPVDKLPEREADLRMLKGEKLIRDVLEIIENKIRYCEITSDYAASSMRAGLKAAVRRAVYRWNRSHDEKIDYDDLIVHRRKGIDGNTHWFIENKGGYGDA